MHSGVCACPCFLFAGRWSVLCCWRVVAAREEIHSQCACAGGEQQPPQSSFRASRGSTLPRAAFALRAKESSLTKLSRFERRHSPSKSVRASRGKLLLQKAFALRARNSSLKKLSRFARETPPSKSFRASRKKLPPQKDFALRAKLTPLVRKLLVFAGTPRRPATPGIPALDNLLFRVMFLNCPPVKHSCGAPKKVRPWRNKPRSLIFAPNPPRATPIRLASPKLEAFEEVYNTAKPAFREAPVSFI